jgi:AcrR family transcriptional regulator
MIGGRRATGVRQQQIIEAARFIIASKGMEELTIREVAREVGISEGDIYRHFNSKRNILLLLMDDIERTLLEAVDSAVSEGKDPLANLRQILEVYLSDTEQRRGVSFLVIAETMRLRDRELRQRMAGVITRYLVRIRGILEQGMASGHIKGDCDPEATALLFFT